MGSVVTLNVKNIQFVQQTYKLNWSHVIPFLSPLQVESCNDVEEREHERGAHWNIVTLALLRE